MSERVQQKLREGKLDTLVSAALDHLLSRPIADLVNARDLAHQIVLGLNEVAQHPEGHLWLVAQLKLAMNTTPQGFGRDHLSTDIAESIRNIIAQPITPNREMVGRLMEHGAVENLLRELLVGALQGFAAKLRPSIRGGQRTRERLQSLKRISGNMMGGLGAELERQAEHKVKDFVDSILASVIAQAADNLCDPDQAESHGRFRGHLFDQLLDTPLSDVSREINKVSPEQWVATVVSMIRAQAERPCLEDDLTGLLSSGLAALGAKTGHALLAESHSGEQIRASFEQGMLGLATDFIETPEFREWLHDLLETEEPSVRLPT
jgi:hypothetical protein